MAAIAAKSNAVTKESMNGIVIDCAKVSKKERVGC